MKVSEIINACVVLNSQMCEITGSSAVQVVVELPAATFDPIYASKEVQFSSDKLSANDEAHYLRKYGKFISLRGVVFVRA